MKLYDFHCNECGKNFEDLVASVADARCPACAASNVRKEISTFAVGREGSGTSAPAPTTGGCAGGFCGGGGCGLD